MYTIPHFRFPFILTFTQIVLQLLAYTVETSKGVYYKKILECDRNVLMWAPSAAGDLDGVWVSLRGIGVGSIGEIRLVLVTSGQVFAFT